MRRSELEHLIRAAGLVIRNLLLGSSNFREPWTPGEYRMYDKISALLPINSAV